MRANNAETEQRAIPSILTFHGPRGVESDSIAYTTGRTQIRIVILRMRVWTDNTTKFIQQLATSLKCDFPDDKNSKY